MDGRWFHQALERVNATQADLARHLRLAPSAVSRMMKGERQMKLLEAVQIADFLGASQEEVLRHAGRRRRRRRPAQCRVGAVGYPRPRAGPHRRRRPH